MAKKEVAEVRTSADLPGVAEFAASVIAEPSDNGAEAESAAALPGTPEPAPRRRRSKGAKDPVRQARARKMWETRRARTGSAPGTPQGDGSASEQAEHERRLQSWSEQAQELAPLVHMGVSEFVDPHYPERPYTLDDATQLSAAAVPVMEKYGVAGKLGRFPEITLLVVVLLQVNAYR